jgi:hypothetical protein
MRHFQVFKLFLIFQNAVFLEFTFTVFLLPLEAGKGLLRSKMSPS